MFQLGKSKELIHAERVLIEVMRIVKISNSSSLFGISEEDVDYFIKNIARDYLQDDFEGGKKILDMAVTQLSSLAQKESGVNLGDFNRLCYATDAQIKDSERTQNLISPHRTSKKDVSREKLAEIKLILKNAVKSLPYNKDVRVKYSDTKDDLEANQLIIQQLNDRDGTAIKDLVSYGVSQDNAKNFVGLHGTSLAIKCMIQYTKMASEQKKEGNTMMVLSFAEFLQLQNVPN